MSGPTLAEHTAMAQHAVDHATRSVSAWQAKMDRAYQALLAAHHFLYSATQALAASERANESIVSTAREVSSAIDNLSVKTADYKQTCCQGECDDCGGLDDNGEGV